MNIRNIMEGIISEEENGYGKLRFEAAKQRIINEKTLYGVENVIDKLYQKFKYIDNNLTYSNTPDCADSIQKLTEEQKKILKEIVVTTTIRDLEKALEQTRLFAKECCGAKDEHANDEEEKMTKIEIEVEAPSAPSEPSAQSERPASLFGY